MSCEHAAAKPFFNRGLMLNIAACISRSTLLRYLVLQFFMAPTAKPYMEHKEVTAPSLKKH